MSRRPILHGSSESEARERLIHVNSIKAGEIRKLVRQLFYVVGYFKMFSCIVLLDDQVIFNRAALDALGTRLSGIFVEFGGLDIAYKERRGETIIDTMDAMGHAAVEFPNQVDAGYPPCSMELFDVGTQLAGFVYRVLEAYHVKKTADMDDECLDILAQHQKDIAAAYPQIMSCIDPSALIIVSGKADQPMAS
jgi:hypothetical protein